MFHLPMRGSDVQNQTKENLKSLTPPSNIFSMESRATKTVVLFYKSTPIPWYYLLVLEIKYLVSLIFFVERNIAFW